MDKLNILKEDRLRRTKSVLLKEDRNKLIDREECKVDLEVDGENLWENEIVLWIIYVRIRWSIISIKQWIFQTNPSIDLKPNQLNPKKPNNDSLKIQTWFPRLQTQKETFNKTI